MKLTAIALEGIMETRKEASGRRLLSRLNGVQVGGGSNPPVKIANKKLTNTVGQNDTRRYFSFKMLSYRLTQRF